MKRVFAFVLALALVFSLSITAFATETPTPVTPANGTITVTNATIGKDYTVYKIFDATYSPATAEHAKAVTYYTEKDTPAYKMITSAEGKKYFTYNEENGNVAKVEGVNDTELIAFVSEQVKNGGYNFPITAGPIKANSTTVEFSGLSFGYYLITSSLNTTVTISSNAPWVEVIDKNQKPGANFRKDIIVGGSIDEDKKASAAIGDLVNYEIYVESTNYDAQRHIQYYQILDTIGSSLEPVLDSFRVKVGDELLKKGWILNNTSETGVVTEGKLFIRESEDEVIPDYEKDGAEWYLVYLGKNQFRVTIPWQTNHTITGQTGAYKITYATETSHASIYDSPSSITLNYSAYVQPDAPIGGGTHDALTNTANASWTSANETGTTPTDSVLTEVFGLGLLKDDSSTGQNLQGAEFRIWRTEEYNQETKKYTYKDAVNVIPTGIEGVYMLDSTTARTIYGTGEGKVDIAKLAAYLEKYKKTGGQEITHENYVITPENGKIVVLGLDAGRYYLQETVAPEGYNPLSQAAQLEVGQGQTPFYVFADGNGNVADLRDPDGTHSRYTYNVTHTTVSNSRGVELPSTGGKGTMLMITFGTMVAMAFGVLLITHKKMSIYKDF